MRTIAISDIHGFSKTFNSLLDRVGLLKDDQLCVLGDCIDRGPESKGVMDIIIKLQQDGYKVHYIMGNHEEMMLKAHYSPTQSDYWFLNGGDATLKSFGVTKAKDIPAKYIQLIEPLDYVYDTSDAIFVHAGLNMLNEDPYQDENSKLWITNWYNEINYGWLNHRKIIHGHIPRSQYEIEKSLENIDKFPVMSIDNGCYYEKAGFNHLCALDLTNSKLYFNKNKS